MLSTKKSCGFPSPATDFMEEQLSLDQRFIKHPAATFFARASGDSMEWAGIMDGSTLLVDRSLKPISGDIIIALLDGELLVKRFVKQQETIVLSSENPSYAPITLNSEQTLDIWGVITACINTFR